MVYEGLNAGDETRRNGDYVGLPHDEATDEIDEGELVTHDGTDISPVSDVSDTGSDIFGVLYTYQYSGDSGGAPQPDSNIEQDSDATVKVSGTVVADLSSFSVSAGDALGPHGEVLVLRPSDSGSGHYEVLLR